MKNSKFTKLSMGNLLGLFFISTFLFSQNANAKSIYIDPQVQDFPEVSGLNTKTFQLVSHGRPGALLLNGKWCNATEIISFLRTNHLLNGQETSINIYGCEFAKGEKGMQAIATIGKELGIDVAASTNITGKHGDWILEKGKAANVLNMAGYPYDLQTICMDTTYVPVNAGWSVAPASPAYAPPTGCNGTNYGSTTNADVPNDRGFDTWYDSPSGYLWSRTLSGLTATKKYRIYVNMYSYSNAPDKRDSYFQNYNLAGQTGTFVCHGNTNTVDQIGYNFIVTNKTSLSFSGTIVGSPWNGCEQAVNYRVVITVSEVVSANTYASPTLIDSMGTNVCPALTTNLTNEAMGCDNNATLEWHTSNVGYSNSTKVVDITDVPDGTYYAICHNTTKACYSSPSAALTVTNVVCNPLPIDFKSSYAYWSGNDANIVWTVADEVNNDHFSMERSFDGKNFDEIKQIKSTGNHKDDYDYTFSDANAKIVVGDRVFYRIKQIDYNGTATTSPVMTLSANNTKEVAYVYPNPISADYFNFVYEGDVKRSTPVDIQIIDAYGRSVYKTEKQMTTGRNIIPISTAGLNAGMYFLKYSDKENNIKGVIRIVKK